MCNFLLCKKKIYFQTQQNLSYLKKRKNFLKKNFTKNPDYLVDGFPKYVRREEMTRLLARIELFKKINPNSRGIVFKEGMGYKDLYKERTPTYESYYDIKIKEIDADWRLGRF